MGSLKCQETNDSFRRLQREEIIARLTSLTYDTATNAHQKSNITMVGRGGKRRSSLFQGYRAEALSYGAL
jgi:hypothetical protein